MQELRKFLAGKSDENVFYLRRTDRESSSGTRGLNTATGSEGGYTVPNEMMRAIVRAESRYAPVLDYASVHVTETGRDLPIPSGLDLGEGEWIDEEAPNSGGDELEYGSVNLKAWKASSKIILVSRELVEDSPEFNSSIGSLLGERCSRLMAGGFVAGDGIKKATGLLHLTNGIANSGITTAANNAISVDELIDLAFTVDEAYRERPTCCWMMSDTIHKLVLKAAKDYPSIYQVSDGKRPRLLGHPLLVSPEMPTGAGAKAVIFGDLSFYHIRLVNEIALIRLRELYMPSGQYGFLAIQRCDGRLVSVPNNPIKYLTLAA